MFTFFNLVPLVLPFCLVYTVFVSLCELPEYLSLHYIFHLLTFIWFICAISGPKVAGRVVYYACLCGGTRIILIFYATLKFLRTCMCIYLQFLTLSTSSTLSRLNTVRNTSELHRQ